MIKLNYSNDTVCICTLESMLDSFIQYCLIDEDKHKMACRNKETVTTNLLSVISISLEKQAYYNSGVIFFL